MPTLSGPQLAQLAIQAGFPQSEAATAAAVALAESGGRTDAISPTGDYGPWQINRLAHPDLFRQYIWNDPSGLQNAKMAFSVWSAAGGSWSPWSTYKSGRYKLFLGQTGSANGSGVLSGATAGGALGSSDTGASAPGGDPSAGIAAFVTAASDPTFWTRVALFLGGVLLAFVGLHGLLKHSDTYNKLSKSALMAVAL